MKTKTIIGRQDIADFPDLQMENIEVKIDTGAYTSSFHCHSIEAIDINGKENLRCFFLDPEHEQYDNKEIIFAQFSKKKVRTSNDMMEERYSVITTIKLFEITSQIELTLTERGNMRFPVLLGRKFISKKFVVDSAKKNLSARKIKISIKS